MFSAHEILDIALNIEVEGEKFYLEMAKVTKSEASKTMFTYLARQEGDHIVTFRNILKKFEEEARDLVNWDEASEYLKSVSEHKVFPPAETLIRKFKNSEYDEVLDYAIEREKDTVIFYTEILELLGDEDSRDSVKKIIAEEKKHIMILREKKN